MVEIRDQPVKNANTALSKAEESGDSNVSSVVLISMTGGVEHKADKVDNRDNQRTKRDGTKRVGHGAFECAHRGPLGHSLVTLGAIIPRAIHTANGDVDHILDHFSDVIAGKCHIDNETNELALRATTIGAFRVVFVGRPLDVNGDKDNGEKDRKGSRNKRTQRRDKQHGWMLSGHVNDGLQNHGRKWDSVSHGPIAERRKARKDQKDNAC